MTFKSRFSRRSALLPVAAATALLAVLFCAHAPEARCRGKVHRIGILSWKHAETADIIREGIRAGLVRSREAVLIEEADCDADPARAEAALKAWEDRGTALVFAVGGDAAQWVLDRKTATPLVAASSGAGAAVALSGRLASAGPMTDCVFLEPDAEAVIAVFARFVPGLSRLGFLYSRGCDSAGAELAAARSALASGKSALKGIAIVPRAVDPAEGLKGLEQSFKSLVESGVQAIWLPDDPYLVSRIEALGDMSESCRMPLVASHPHGARRQTVAAISPGYRNLGIAAAAAGLRMLRTGEKPAQTQVTRSFHVVLNLRAAERSGIVVPLESIVHADVIVDRDGW